MSLHAQAGRGAANFFRAAENGEPLAYWAAGFLLFYIVASVVFLGFNWATGRPLSSRRDLAQYTAAFGISLAFAAYVLYGIVSRLPT